MQLKQQVSDMQHFFLITQYFSSPSHRYTMSVLLKERLINFTWNVMKLASDS